MKHFVNVIFCDNHILVAEKQAGWLTQPDGSNHPDLETAAKDWLKEKFNKPGAVFLHALHRIDRPVSGLVLFARSSKALTRLNEEIRQGAIRRIYFAEVEGTIAHNGTLEHYLAHGCHRAIVSSPEKGCLARLSYHVEQSAHDRTLVRIELQTGRYHQIRAQFSAIRHPIIGDTKYGAQTGDGKSIRLHCASLIFIHPVTKKELSFHSNPHFPRS
jgi:23S rRNA pseudouridine1911/1915/1917 synthase